MIGRDHLDTGSVASPFRETEAMKDGSDAIADWPILNALLNVASGASWVSFHHGGGVGIGNSLHAGQVIVADGTPEMRVRLERVLTNDPGIGVARHADAGYEIAIETARDARRHPCIPMPQCADGPSHALRALQALARPALPRASTRGSRRARRPVLVHFEVTHALQRALRLLRLLEDARRAKARRAEELRRRGALLQPDAGHVHRRRADLRRDLEDLVAAVDARGAPQVRHADHARRHAHAGARAVAVGRGINQFNISLDYLDGRHDAARGIPGPDREDLHATSRRCATRGIDSIRFNTVIKDDNLDQLMPIVAARARSSACGVNFSVYTDAKNGNGRI